MNTPEKLYVVTDTGSSFRPEDLIAQQSGIRIIPLQLSILEAGGWVAKQETDIAPGQFYTIMRDMIAHNGELPRTSGLNPGIAKDMYMRLFQEGSAAGIFSVHITAAHSQAMNAARLGAEEARQETGEELPIIVADSQQLTLGQWWVAETAARLAAKGAALKQVAEEIAELLPRIRLYAVLENFENLKLGGRADQIKGRLASVLSALHIHPILGFKDGKLDIFGRARNAAKARMKMVDMTFARGQLERVGVVHTNAPQLAETVRQALSRFVGGFIPIVDAGPALAVHAGERAVGVVSQVS